MPKLATMLATRCTSSMAPVRVALIESKKPREEI
jgi:hypothetical protein